MGSSQLIAHRGLPARFPENTLIGLEAAVASGARWLEVDIQLTGDRIPILYHDDLADRVSGCATSVFGSTLSDLQRFGAFCPNQFGATYRGTPIATLDQLVRRMNDWPGVRAFIEIKRHSLDHFGHTIVRERIEHALADLIDRESVAAMISKDEAILEAFRELGWPIGWVLPSWCGDTERVARQLQPEYLFAKQARVPDDDRLVWQGRWNWVVYPIDDACQAARWRVRGWPFVETNTIDTLIDHPQWTDSHDATHQSM